MLAHNLPIEAIVYIVIDTLLPRLVWCNTKHAPIKESLIYARYIFFISNASVVLIPRDTFRASSTSESVTSTGLSALLLKRSDFFFPLKGSFPVGSESSLKCPREDSEERNRNYNENYESADGNPNDHNGFLETNSSRVPLLESRQWAPLLESPKCLLS